MAAGNGDTNYMPLKCEYPDEGDDDELPDENDFIAPLDYIDPVSKVATLYVVKNSFHDLNSKNMKLKCLFTLQFLL